MGDALLAHGALQDPQREPPIADGQPYSSGHPRPSSSLPDCPKQQHYGPQSGNAFSSQFDMAQSSASRAAAFDMGGMTAALPPVAYSPTYIPGGQPQQGYTTGLGLPPTSQMQQPPQYAIQSVPLSNQPYYPQLAHPMQPYYPVPVYPAIPLQTRQNAVYRQPHMPPSPHSQAPQGQPAGYYYPNVNTFANPSQTMHQMSRQYVQIPQPLVDHRAAVSSPIVTSMGSRPYFNYDNRSPRPRTGNSESDSIDGRHAMVRGPPRKPKQRGHAIWIGNLPPHTDLMSLVNHVCKEAPGLESLFLISKSNCAFANFKDEQACAAAQQKLHDSRFQTVRLVSRLRKATMEKQSASAPAPEEPTPASSPAPYSDGDAQNEGTTATPAETLKHTQSDRAGEETHGRERYFVLKSLTVEDLEMSARNGIWATQSHNEDTLGNAFKAADNVYLIFSANKSGEYFGYARMTSPINEDPEAAIEFAPSAQTTGAFDLPKAIPTEAAEYAPKGRIIDDSARGTIFWEVERDEPDGAEGADGIGEDKSDGESLVGADGDLDEMPRSWGKPFTLEWLSTTRVPFYRTRGLRNPWNSNREVKIARDGTELEPNVGRRLIGLFSIAQNPTGPASALPRPAMGVTGYTQGPGRPYP